jgi:hypothetical protein
MEMESMPEPEHEQKLRGFQEKEDVKRVLEPTWIQSFWDFFTKTKG